MLILLTYRVLAGTFILCRAHLLLVTPLRGRRIPADAPPSGSLANARTKTFVCKFKGGSPCSPKNLPSGKAFGSSKASACCAAHKNLFSLGS